MDLKEPLIKANRVYKYSISYQEITEESREYGEISDDGFIIENETDEIGNLLKLAVETYGIYYPVAFGWWESTNPVENKNYFEKGIETYYILHITNEDGTNITEKEYDFITFLLSDGNYNKDEFTEYAVGGIVAGALALGIGGLIAYYYFNKGKKGYPTGRAWTKEHYNDNDDEDYEVSPNERNIKHKARNRQFDNGGEVILFNRYASMDSATMSELQKMTSYPFLREYFEDEDGEKKYDRIQSALEKEGVSVNAINNYLSGLYDGYNYSNTDDFKKEMAKLKIADKEFYDRIIKVYEKISKYPKIDKMMANGGGIEKEKSLRHFILEQVSSGMIANKIPYSDYKTIDAIRFNALQILNRDGDREYSMKSFSDLIQEALLEYEENKYENKFDNGGGVATQKARVIDYYINNADNEDLITLIGVRDFPNLIGVAEKWVNNRDTYYDKIFNAIDGIHNRTWGENKFLELGLEKFANGGGVNEKENNRYWKPINKQTLSFYNLTQNSSLQEIDYDDTFLNGKVWIAFRKLPNEVTQIPYEVKMLIKEDFEYYSYGANASFIKVSLMEGSWFSMYIDFENLTFKHLEEMLLQLPLQVEERLEDKNIKGYGELGFYDYGQSIELEISNTFSKANGGGVGEYFKKFENDFSSTRKGGVKNYSVDIDLENGEQLRGGDLDFKDGNDALFLYERIKKKGEYQNEKIEDIQLIANFKNGDYESVDIPRYDNGGGVGNKKILIVAGYLPFEIGSVGRQLTKNDIPYFTEKRSLQYKGAEGLNLFVMESDLDTSIKKKLVIKLQNQWGETSHTKLANGGSMANGGGVENAEMPIRERTTITKPTTTPTTTPSKPDKKNPYKPKHIPKPKARK